MTDLLFSPAWWMLAAGGVLAVAMFVAANARLDTRLRNASFAVLALVVAWGVTGYLVETSVESARNGTGRFVQAVVKRDATTMGGLLSPDVSLGRLSRDEIVRLVPGYAEEWGLKSALITGWNIDDRGTQVTANVRVFTQHEGGRAAISTYTSDWEFAWGRTPDGWRIVQITPVRIGTQDIRGVTERFFSRPR